VKNDSTYSFQFKSLHLQSVHYGLGPLSLIEVTLNKHGTDVSTVYSIERDRNCDIDHPIMIISPNLHYTFGI
jgi:hypothetical protein